MFVSIIILNWNGKKWLKKCLDSLLAQTYKNFEIIFIDNASTDDSVEFVKDNYPSVLVIKNKENLGFAGGNNVGVKFAKGDFVLLLNNDTWARDDYLDNLVKAFQEIPNLGSVQSKIVLMDNTSKLDVCGSYWTDLAFLYHYGYGGDQTLEKYNRSMPFFSNKGASMMIRKELIDKIGLFDVDFWCYYEETDFCNRVWLSGYECWYYPKAVIYHAMGGTALTFKNSYIQYHNFKNKFLSFLKNFEAKTLIKVVPVYIIINTILSLTWLFQGKIWLFFALYKSIWWNILNIRKTLKKRMLVQSFRMKSDKDIFKIVKKNPRLDYYYCFFTGLKKYGD